jgi:uncharacterized phiE125 gp8 family phage protein
MSLRVVTSPKTEPVSLEIAKLHIPVDHDEDDSLISAYIQTAREACEIEQNRCYAEQQLEYSLDAWPCRPIIYLPRAPVKSVDSITYTDSDGAEYELTGYTADIYSEPARI